MQTHGQGFLEDTGLDVVGAVVVVNWGKQMSEQGLVYEHDGNTFKSAKGRTCDIRCVLALFLSVFLDLSLPVFLIFTNIWISRMLRYEK